MAAPQVLDPGFRFDPLSAEFDRDPFPVLARLREQAPVWWWELADAWVLTRHADVVAVMGDEARFSPDPRHWERYAPAPPEHARHPVVRLRDSSLFSYEGAEHTRIRRLASVALTRRAVKSLEPLMRDLVDELLDRVAPRGACDFVADVASVYPVTVVSRLLGVPNSSERELRFKRLADLAVGAFSPVAGEATILRALDAGAKLVGELEALMAEKRAAPGDDLMTDMLLAEAEGDRFSPEEVTSTLLAILVGGAETTANSMAFGLLELLRHPDQLEKFRTDPAVRPAAVHEIVRHQMPGRFLNRYAKRDTEIDGHPVRKGQLVLCCMPAAQRDPAVFEDPDRFDIGRAPRGDTAFGVGRHFCLGAQLAKLELEISLGRVVERLPGLHLACAERDIPYRSNPAVRGPASLLIRFDPSGARQ